MSDARGEVCWLVGCLAPFDSLVTPRAKYMPARVGVGVLREQRVAQSLLWPRYFGKASRSGGLDLGRPPAPHRFGTLATSAHNPMAGLFCPPRDMYRSGVGTASCIRPQSATVRDSRAPMTCR